jgi:hypothetical protein
VRANGTILASQNTVLRKGRAIPTPKKKEDVMDPLAKAIMYLGIKKPNKGHMTEKRARLLSGYFREYGRRWGIDPWLAVSIARAESHFRDYPPKVRKCRIVLLNTGFAKKCNLVWKGERGLMQLIPKYSKQAFIACKGRPWEKLAELSDSKTSICAGMWLMRYRRDKIARKQRERRFFKWRCGRYPYTRRYGPCTGRQRRFCRRNPTVCKKFWWVASYNWGTHQVICGRIKRNLDFAGYPIRVLGRYKKIVAKFRATATTPTVRGPKG